MISQSEVEVKIKNDDKDNLISSFYFNPGIYFPCKLCRHAFPTVEALFKHKRRQHAVAELKKIKFVIFEERFVQDDILPDALFPYKEELLERTKQEDQHETNQIQPQIKPEQKITANSRQVTDSAVTVSENDNPVLTCESNSKFISLKQNPFVLLLKMTAKEIQDAKSNLRNTALTKRTLGVDLVIDPENENIDGWHAQKKANNEEAHIRCSFPDESQVEPTNADLEFIILDIIPKADGEREITFSTTTKINSRQGQKPQTRFQLQPQSKQEMENGAEFLLQPKPVEIDEEISMSVSVSGESESELFENQHEIKALPGEELKSSVHSDSENVNETDQEKENGKVQSTPVKETRESSLALESFKHWLKAYKNDHPENLFFLQPDPLKEPNQCERNDAVKAGTETVLFPLTCQLCKKRLKGEAVTKKHVMSCWKYNKEAHRYCYKCDKHFKSKIRFDTHNHSKHWAPGQSDLRPRIKCPTCGKELIGAKRELRVHMKIHGDAERNLMCEICGSCFRDRSVLSYHRKCHSEERSYKCSQCPKEFKTSRYLLRHKRIHAGVSYRCTFCPNTYRHKKGLNNHTRASHTEDKPFACTYNLGLGGEKCPLKFSTKAHLIAHCRKEHPEKVVSSKIPCTLCSKTFWDKRSLHWHMATHTGIRPLKCTHEGCQRTFTQISNLNEHLRTHTGEKPFQCDGCGSNFWKRYSFLKHCKVSCPYKASAEERNKFPCHLCPRKFPGKWELKRHLKLHEEGKVSADGSVRGGVKGNVKGRGKGKGKEFECQVCDFKCDSKKILKEHLKIHDESKGEDDEEDEIEDGEEESESCSDLETEEYVVEGVEVEMLKPIVKEAMK